MLKYLGFHRIAFLRHSSILHCSITQRYYQARNPIKSLHGRGISSSSSQCITRQSHVPRSEKDSLKKWLKNFETASDFNITRVIETSIKNGYTDRAVQLFSFHRERKPDFRLGYTTYLQLLKALIKENRIQTAQELLEIVDVDRSNSLEDPITRTMIAIFESLKSQNADLTQIDAFVDSLIFSQSYFRSTVFEFIMRLYLIEYENIDATLEFFEKMGKKFKTTSYIQPLMCKLIETENVDGMERVMKISQQIHGKRRSNLNIAFAFTECGRIHQANKIFQSIEITEDDSSMLSFIEFYKMKRKTQYLHNSLKALNNCSSPFIRQRIYISLLEINAEQSNANEVKDICSAMDTEGLVPSETDQLKLIALFRENGIQIPETWPTIERNDSQLTKHLDANELNEANELLCKLLEENQPQTEHTLCYFLSKNAENGKTSIFDYWRKKFDEKTKNQLKFSDYECDAYKIAKRAPEYLSNLIIEFNREDANLKLLVQKLSNNIIEMTTDYPEIYGDFKNLAITLADKGLYKPINIVWTYNFINGVNQGDNKELWQNYLEKKLSFTCIDISRLLYKRKKIDRLREFINLKTLNKRLISPKALGRCYSTLFDGLMIHQKDYESVLVEMKNAIELISIKHLDRNTLQRLNHGSPQVAAKFYEFVHAANN